MPQSERQKFCRCSSCTASGLEGCWLTISEYTGHQARVLAANFPFENPGTGASPAHTTNNMPSSINISQPIQPTSPQSLLSSGHRHDQDNRTVKAMKFLQKQESMVDSVQMKMAESPTDFRSLLSQIERLQRSLNQVKRKVDIVQEKKRSLVMRLFQLRETCISQARIQEAINHDPVQVNTGKNNLCNIRVTSLICIQIDFILLPSITGMSLHRSLCFWQLFVLSLLVLADGLGTWCWA